MAEKYFKFLLFGFLGFSLLVWLGSLGSDDSSDAQFNVNVTQFIGAAEGLNLQAVAELLKQSSDGEGFEKALNAPGNGVNNLDLNEDGQVDYINVQEFGDAKVRGFSLSTQPAPGETQELATIKIEPSGDEGAKVDVKGNEAVYGNNHYYHSSWSPGFGSGLLMGYLFSGGGFWRSPYSYGGYPRTYPTEPYDRYQKRHSNKGLGDSYKRSQSGRFGQTARSPNAGRNASSVKAPLKSPTASQKSYQQRNPSKQVRATGFGRKTRSSGVTKRSSGFGRSQSVRSSRRSGGFSRFGK